MQHSTGISSPGSYQQSPPRQGAATKQEPQVRETDCRVSNQQGSPDKELPRQVPSNDGSRTPKADGLDLVVRRSSKQNLEDKDLPRQNVAVQESPVNDVPAPVASSKHGHSRSISERQELGAGRPTVPRDRLQGSLSQHSTRQNFAKGQLLQEQPLATVMPPKSAREWCSDPANQQRCIQGVAPQRQAPDTESRTVSKEELEPSSLTKEGHHSLIPVLALFAIAIVVIGILIYVTARRAIARPRSVKMHVKACNHTDCLRHAAAIKMAWNNSVDPCEDFYYFVCGSWAARETYRRMEDLIKTSDHIAFTELRSNRLASRKVREFFLSCLHASKDVLSNLGVLKTWATSMGMIRSNNQSQVHVVTRNPLDLLLDLAINWRTGPLNVHAAMHRGKNQRVLILEPAIGVWSKLLHAEDFMFLVDQHVGLLEAQDPRRCNQWNETVAELRAATAGTTARSASDEVAGVVSDLDGLTRGIRKGAWLDFINAHFAPEVTFDNNDPVIVYDARTITNIGSVFEKRSLDALSEVFSWLVVETYLRVILTPNKEHDTEDKTWMTERDCLSHTYSFLGLLGVQRYLQRKFPSWRRASVDTFLKHVRTTWALNVEHAPWIDKYSRRLALKKVHTLNTVLWPADEFFDGEFSETLYATFPDMDKPFMANVIETAVALRGLVNHSHYLNVYTMQMAVAPDLVTYKYHLNEVHIALAALNTPVYYDVEVFAMTYGGLGSLYAQEVSKIYDSTGRSLNANGELQVSPFGEESTEYKEKLRCNVTSGLPSYEYFVHVAGLETAFEAYGAAIPAYARDFDYRLQTLGQYSSDQVFFMTYCHMLCAPRTDYAAQEHCNVPLMNFRPFAKAFHCPAGSYMNPEKKCALFVAQKDHDIKYIRQPFESTVY